MFVSLFIFCCPDFNRLLTAGFTKIDKLFGIIIDVG